MEYRVNHIYYLAEQVHKYFIFVPRGNRLFIELNSNQNASNAF